MSDVMLALDFGGTKVDMALVAAEPGQRVVGRARLDTDADKGAVQVVERALETGRGLLASNGSATPCGIGVASMGYTREDGVDLAPNVPGWEALRLPALIRAGFPGIATVIDNDVRAAALAELKWGALRDTSTGIYLNLGTGVAATIVAGADILSGFHGAAGEVGYWRVPSAESRSEEFDETGEARHVASESGTGGAGASRPAFSTLEAEVGGAGLRRRAHAVGLDGGLAELLASDEPAATALVEDVFAQIALAVTNMALLIDPERIVLGGGYVGAGSRLLETIRDSLDRHGILPAEVVTGRFGSDAGLYGAIALAEKAAGLET